MMSINAKKENIFSDSQKYIIERDTFLFLCLVKKVLSLPIMQLYHGQLGLRFRRVMLVANLIFSKLCSLLQASFWMNQSRSSGVIRPVKIHLCLFRVKD